MNNIKKFEDFLDRMQGLLDEAKKCGHIIVRVEDLENAFPELEEREDERIRKAIIELVKQSSEVLDKQNQNGMIAWLEKQGETFEMKSPEESLGISTKEYNEIANDCLYGESKSDDKFKPKFKVGDYVVGKYISGYITEVRDDCYLLEYQGFPIDKQDNYHLWTIKDAKDGDVLVCPKYAGDIIPNIFIFKDIKIKDNYVFCYCSFLDAFRIEGYIANADPINTDFYPATKEQRDLLFQKMKEAGYEFDFDKKEIKKIEQHGN